MRMYVKLSGNLDTSEGDITMASAKELQDLIKVNPLMAADLLKDWRGVIDSLYGQALAEMRTEFEAMRRKARKRGEIEGRDDGIY